MKTKLKLLLALLALQVFCLGFAAIAATQPICPTYDLNFSLDKVAPQIIDAYHGEMLDIRCNFDWGNYVGDTSSVRRWRFYWQEVGMGDNFWEKEVSDYAVGIGARIFFEPNMDTGAKVYNCFFGEPGANYRAAFQIRMRPSPGAEPNTLPLPVKTLDFAKVRVENAPYYTKEEIDSMLEDFEPSSGSGGSGLTEEQAEKLEKIDSLETRVGAVESAASSADTKATNAGTKADAAKTAADAAKSAADSAANDIGEIKAWALGNDVAVKVEHATETNATFSVLYHGETQYSSDTEAAATVARANEYTDNHLATLAGIVDEKLGEKADRAWGKYTSGGAPANGDTLIVEKKSLAITGGGNFTYIEAETGGYYVATVSLGNTWTLESLADAQNPDNPTTLTWKDSDGNAIQTITSTSSREVYAVAGVDMFAPSCNSQGVDEVVTIPFPVVSTEPPKVLYVPGLDHYGVEDFTEANATNWPDYIKSVSWSGASGNRIAHITMKGHPGMGFFKAKFVKDGTVYTRFDKPIGFSNVVIKGIPYKVDIVTINGHKILEVIED